MTEVQVKLHTQHINVKSPQNQEIVIVQEVPVVTVASSGPIGPAGVQGPEGPEGPQGPSGVHVGTTPPADTSILWYDTN